jgi:hypothetical protein
MMKLNEYQDAAVALAIYPGKLAYPTLGLCGEAGELIEAHSHGQLALTVLKEIGDVLWYVANDANDADLPLSEVGVWSHFDDIDDCSYCDSASACTGLSIFVGVVAENIKKTLRDHGGVLTHERRENVRVALNGVLAALAVVASDYSSSLAECASINLKKLQSRADRGKLQGDGNDR